MDRPVRKHWAVQVSMRGHLTMTDQKLNRPLVPGNSLEAAQTEVTSRVPTAPELANAGGEEPCPPTLPTGTPRVAPSGQVPA